MFKNSKEIDRLAIIFNSIKTGNTNALPDRLSALHQEHSWQRNKERQSIEHVLDVLRNHKNVQPGSICESIKGSQEDIQEQRDIHFNYVKEDIKISNIGIQVKSSMSGVKEFLDKQGNTYNQIIEYLDKHHLIVLNGNLERFKIEYEFNRQLKRIVRSQSSHV